MMSDCADRGAFYVSHCALSAALAVLLVLWKRVMAQTKQPWVEAVNIAEGANVTFNVEENHRKFYTRGKETFNRFRLPSATVAPPALRKLFFDVHAWFFGDGDAGEPEEKIVQYRFAEKDIWKPVKGELQVRRLGANQHVELYLKCPLLDDWTIAASYEVKKDNGGSGVKAATIEVNAKPESWWSSGLVRLQALC